MSERDEALAAAGGDYEKFTKAWKMTPEGITDAEWEYYQISWPSASMNPVFKAKVEKAMGWKPKDIADAEEIASQVSGAMDRLSREQGWDKDRPVGPVVIARLRAALRLISPDDITPMGKRILEKILDEEEKR